MKKERGMLILGSALLTACLIEASVACQGKGTAGETFETVAQVPVEWDVQKAARASGVDIKIMRSEVIDRDVTLLFLWILVKTRTSGDQTRLVAQSVIDEIRAWRPAAFHGLTLHFIESPGLKRGPNDSPSYARATFFPEGNPEKIGRVPIDGYGSYKLVCESR